jgi:flagellar assembly protein FliH
MPSRALRLPAATAVEAFAWTPVKGGSPRREGRAPNTTTSDPAREAADAAAASDRLAALERDAFVKGYAKGERSGLEAAARQGEVSLRRLAETIDEMASLRADLLGRSERELVRLAVSIAERVIRREIALDPSLIAAMAKVAIEQLGDNPAAEIRLHPADHMAFLAAANGTPFPPSVQILSDAGVTRGGCIVRSDFGQMDLDVTSQILEISRSLLGPESQAPAPAGAVAAVANAR